MKDDGIRTARPARTRGTRNPVSGRGGVQRIVPVFFALCCTSILGEKIKETQATEEGCHRSVGRARSPVCIHDVQLGVRPSCKVGAGTGQRVCDAWGCAPLRGHAAMGGGSCAAPCCLCRLGCVVSERGGTRGHGAQHRVAPLLRREKLRRESTGSSFHVRCTLRLDMGPHVKADRSRRSGFVRARGARFLRRERSLRSVNLPDDTK